MAFKVKQLSIRLWVVLFQKLELCSTVQLFRTFFLVKFKLPTIFNQRGVNLLPLKTFQQVFNPKFNLKKPPFLMGVGLLVRMIHKVSLPRNSPGISWKLCFAKKPRKHAKDLRNTTHKFQKMGFDMVKNTKQRSVRVKHLKNVFH